jgi:hypothetical protein
MDKYRLPPDITKKSRKKAFGISDSEMMTITDPISSKPL